MINLVATVELIRLLHDQPLSAAKLSELTGAKRQTVLRWIKMFRKNKLVRISEWHRSFKGSPVPFYEWNAEGLKEVPMPVPKTSAERNREARRRKKLATQLNLPGKG